MVRTNTEAARVSHLGVVHEGVAGAGVRGQLAGAGELQALDDRLQGGQKPSKKNPKNKNQYTRTLQMLGEGDWIGALTVLPAPLGPTMRVRGLKKVMTFLFSGSKLRIPLISILSTVLILPSPYSSCC